MKEGYTLAPHDHEVADIFEVPLSFLLTDKNRETHTREWQGLTRRYYAYPFGEALYLGRNRSMIKNLGDRLYGNAAHSAELPSLADAAWLQDRRLQSLLAVLNSDGGETRVAGGAVRNALLGVRLPMSISTHAASEEVTRRCKAAGFGVHPRHRARHGHAGGAVDSFRDHNAPPRCCNRRPPRHCGLHQRLGRRCIPA